MLGFITKRVCVLEFVVRNSASAWISLFKHSFQRQRVSLDFADERFNFLAALSSQIIRNFFVSGWPLGGSLIHKALQSDLSWMLTPHVCLGRRFEDIAVEVVLSEF